MQLPVKELSFSRTCSNSSQGNSFAGVLTTIGLPAAASTSMRYRLPLKKLEKPVRFGKCPGRSRSKSATPGPYTLIVAVDLRWMPVETPVSSRISVKSITVISAFPLGGGESTNCGVIEAPLSETERINSNTSKRS